MPHFYYIPKQNVEHEKLLFGEEESHHIYKVMRKTKGETIWATDGEGNLYYAIIERIIKSRVEARILKSQKFQREYEVNLFTAIPKAKRIDYLVEKCTELGVARIYPIVTERSVKESCRVDRLRRIAISAIKQAELVFLPEIYEPEYLDDVLEELPPSDVILIAQKDAELTLHDLLYNIKKINIFIGPEGGFTENELARFKKLDAKFVSLCKNTLRVETACVVGLTIIAHEKSREQLPLIAETS